MVQYPRELIRNDVVLKSVRRANVAADYWISGMTLTSFFVSSFYSVFRSNHTELGYHGQVLYTTGWWLV